MFGLGLIKGLSVTMRHFIESYTYDRNPLKWFSLKGRYDDQWLEKRQAIDGKGLFTIQYPEQKRKITENFRFIPMLVYEESIEEPRCTACGICARVCPPQCIWIERATDAKGRPKAQPAGFWIDATMCMSCGYCAEFCPFDAIKMNQEHELAYSDRDAGMFYNLDRLLRPVSYYAEIHPGDFAREEEARRAKEEAKRKAAEAKEAVGAKQKVEAKKKAEAAPAETSASAEPDDLTRIEGIDSKISGVLQAAGISTFARLADTDVDRIKQILGEADPNLLKLADPDTWRRQAKLAASGKWEALERWQERLKGGKGS
ncbi:MAG TPA: 4Fe-4S binding protein [Anaerolineae bacterium]|nr:4Fe-4S binding protein [Anaerolineae bacterium]